MKITRILGLAVGLTLLSTVTTMAKGQKLSQKISKEVSNSLMTNDGTSTTEDLSECKYVMYLFGTSKRKTTKPFVEKVTKFYNDHKEASKLGAVYISFEANKEALVSFATDTSLPCKSLQFSKKKLRARLKKGLKVSKIPSMVIVDGEGNVVLNSSAKKSKTAAKNGDILQKFTTMLDTKSGDTAKENVVGDHDLVKMLGKTVIDKKGESSDYKPFDHEYNVVYFSAHWCGFCRSFTPKLVKSYKRKLKKKNISVTFVSSDRSEKDMKNYMKKFKMPWHAMKFNERNTKLMRGSFKLKGLPSMLVFDKAGNLLKGSDKVKEIQSMLKWLERKKKK